ncbi:hypothetical protein ACQ5SO_11090 [Rhodovulum sp. DZ06]|uniref:hypothetical protein n=1 Tax=Rhodovulum sp. DZ06 TaxID=3425126 RepID=UPI003D33C7F0
MPPPSLKALRALQSLADLRWQQERRRLAEAQAVTGARQAAVDALGARREAERDAIRDGTPNLQLAAAAARFEGWAKSRNRTLLAATRQAEEAEQLARDRAAEEFGRLRALEHVAKRAKREADRLRRAAQERDGQPES